jgi:hypothetical protein
MKTTTLLLGVAAALFMAAPAALARTDQPQLAQAAPTDKLTGLAAWGALVGNTVVGKIEDKDFTDYYVPDGTVKSMMEGQVATGKWSLEGDKICFVYPDEPRECYTIEVVGDAARFQDKSGASIRGQILKGNAKNF